ncbi:MAG: hypothetical protein CK531_07115 [Gemmatimonadetes bacterium]|nr:MAG: hypothetical protein CK531_07115 [Gemmatimonadota bacterium]
MMQGNAGQGVAGIPQISVSGGNPAATYRALVSQRDILGVLLPMSIAFSRRISRRSAKVEVVLPPEMSERMAQLERGVESIAIEVERTSEGQRFVTQVLVARSVAREGQADPVLNFNR